MIRLHFVGTGEAFDPERPNTSVVYEGARTLLIDCGYAVPHALWRLRRDPSWLDAVYLTHRHADHSFGLPPLLAWMRTAGRTRPLTVFAGAGNAGFVPELLESGYPGAFAPTKCFPIEVVEIPLAPSAPLAWGGLELSAARTRHSVPNHALRIRAETEPTVCVSGDGAPTPESLALYRGAEVLVHECYDPTPGYANHANAAELFPAIEAAGVRELYAVHLRNDANARRAVAQLAAAHPGQLRIALPGPGTEVIAARNSRESAFPRRDGDELMVQGDSPCEGAPIRQP
jgi:ribonuclease BN (tRNA processing enzyme)